MLRPAKFRSEIFWIVVLIATFASVDFLFAENQIISLEQIKIIALDKSPLVKQIDADFSKKMAESLETKLLPNPELSSEIRIPVSYSGERGSNEAEVSLSQPFRLSHFGLRAEVSRLIEKAADNEQKTAILELTQTVTLSYVKLWALEQQYSFLEEAKQRAEKKASAVQEATTKGLLGAGDEKLFVAEARKISALLVGVESDIASARAELTRIVGTNFEDLKTSKPSIEPPLPLDDLLQKAAENSVGMASRTNLLLRVADKQYQLAERDMFPALSPRIVYEHTSDETDRIGVGISMPLPIFSRNQSERLSKRAEFTALRAKADYANSETFRNELSSLRRAYGSSLKQAVIFDKEVIPAFREALSFHERQFNVGQGTILQVWQTQRELNISQGEVLELWVKAFAARTQLAIVVGEEL